MKWVIVLLIILASRSTVVITVVDSQQNPLEGADIYFCARYAVSDAQGMATFKEIPDPSGTPSGACMVEIRKEGYLTIVDAVAVTEDMSLQYILYSAILSTLSGIVYFDTSDNPAPFIALRMYDARTHEFLGPVLTDAEGRFSFEVSEDRSVYCIVSDYEDQKFFLSSDTDQVLVVRTAGILADVEVTVRDDKGRAIEKAHVTLEAGETLFEGETDSKGIVTFQQVVKGDYTLVVQKEGYTPVERGVSVAPSERGGLYSEEVTMVRAEGVLHVSVNTESGVPLSALVTITGVEETRYVSIEGEADVSLLPGTYTVQASCAGYTSETQQVELVENGVRSVTFFLEKQQRTVTVVTKSFPWEVILLGVVIAVLVAVLFLKKR
ncbi:MAG: carboxypeptidase regulatory-like domain-containing protein [Theionarchaea archaeon]|nr:carboxypeptidase regulatory-like domain-containing protein [Theionarchaea archaeon]MBU7001354.1 carboxypeptidase regulatory-like domain-containing protein [Theionarchaea archaeon]MBU7019414.1 carboxypeptidase regulatory-like domain-containing protein [Theionarchaea archaeon]